MPYKVFSAGEEALASDANSYLMSQTVPRFASAAQRTAQLTAPVLNQLSMRDDRAGVIERWDGTAWTDLGTEGWKEAQLAPLTVNPGTSGFTEFPLVMPRAGVLIVDGFANMGSPANYNQFNVSFAGSAPAASNHGVVNARLNQSSIDLAAVPVKGRWGSVNAGQTVTVRLTLQVFGGTGAIQMLSYYLSWRVMA